MNDPSSAEAIDVDVSVEDAPDKCQKCGIATNRYNRDLKKPICVACSLGPAEAKKMLEAFSGFESIPEMTPEEMESHGIGASAGRILTGALLLGGMTYATSLLLGRVGSWIGWFVGVVVVGVVVFRKAHPLDLVRWRRFWRGHLVGFLLGPLVGLFTFMADAGGTGPFSASHAEAMMPVLEAQLYGLATLVGIVTGFLWLSLKNGDDRDELVVLFREWHRRRAL